MRCACWLLVLALVACHPRPAVAPPPPVASERHADPAPTVPEIAPIDLALARPAASRAWHARIVHYSRAWVRDGGDPIEETSQDNEVDREVPLAGEKGDRARVLIEEDDARVCVWMPRADLARVITTTTTLRVDGAPNGGTVGLGAHGGAHVTDRHGDLVTITDDDLVATGHVPESALGDAWGPEPARPRIGQDAPELAASIAIRARPSNDGAVLATPTTGIPVRVVARHGDWTEIAAGGPRLEVDGFVPTAAIGKAEGFGVGEGFGDGYGISDTINVDVEAGACLRDRQDGEVIGVETAARTRYAEPTQDKDRFEVFVGTPWGTTLVAYRKGDGCGVPPPSPTSR